tara:strand:- start:567 stop:716 length:150 start_codon:yes stop_codon:yes gene_type:complete
MTIRLTGIAFFFSFTEQLDFISIEGYFLWRILTESTLFPGFYAAFYFKF